MDRSHGAGSAGIKEFCGSLKPSSRGRPVVFFLKPEDETQIECFVSASWARSPAGPGARSPVLQPFTSSNDDCRQPSLTGAIVFRIPFGLTEFVGDHLMPTHPGIQPASSNTIGFNVALDLRCRRFSQLRRYRRVNRRSGNFFRFRGRLLIRFRGGDRRGRFFRSHERRGEWG